jgi:SAM-dependent methyltransferase
MVEEISSLPVIDRRSARRAGVRTLRPPAVSNLAFHAAGLLMLGANKVRHEVQGYRRPRPFSPALVRTAIDYDTAVVTKWLDALEDYSARDALQDATVLELGPGPDLGVGLTLLQRGARAYHALDVNELAKLAPWDLYEGLLDELGEAAGSTRREHLLRQVKLALAGRGERLEYVCDRHFDVSRFVGRGIDIVFSQAAFEHFDDPDRTIEQLSEVVQPGGILISEIDLQTHSRWLRDADPLNIYRYSERVYRTFRFSGSPNRWRPEEYRKSLLRHGWRDVVLLPGSVLDAAYLGKVLPTLNGAFRDEAAEMGVLNLVVCATRA